MRKLLFAGPVLAALALMPGLVLAQAASSCFCLRERATGGFASNCHEDNSGGALTIVCDHPGGLLILDSWDGYERIPEGEGACGQCRPEPPPVDVPRGS